MRCSRCSCCICCVCCILSDVPTYALDYITKILLFVCVVFLNLWTLLIYFYIHAWLVRLVRVRSRQSLLTFRLLTCRKPCWSPKRQFVGKLTNVLIKYCNCHTVWKHTFHVYCMSNYLMVYFVIICMAYHIFVSYRIVFLVQRTNFINSYEESRHVGEDCSSQGDQEPRW